MNKRTKTDRELLLDASLEFIMNSPDEVFDQYLKEAGEDASELERRATDAIGAALARHESAAASGSPAPTIQDKLAALSVAQQREVALQLGVPRNVVTAFRERRVIPTTVPRTFLSRLASAIAMLADELLAVLSAPPAPQASHQHKSDEKPQAPTQATFEQLLKDGGVSPERRAELLRDGS